MAGDRVASGYNNASGKGKLFILDAKDGSLLKTMSTGAGIATHAVGARASRRRTQRTSTTSSPSRSTRGDLLGNFWRFDVSDPNASNWGASAKLAQPGRSGGDSRSR